MTFELEVESLEDLERQVQQLFDDLRVPVQRSMAYRLQDITQSNFGAGEGEDRPEPWQQLSWNYAQRFHGGILTPTETLTGDMRDSIQVEDTNPEFSRVFSDLDYAPIQQWGGGEWNTPARPFFPIVGDQTTGVLTQYTETELHLAAEEAIAEYVRSL